MSTPPSPTFSVRSAPTTIGRPYTPVSQRGSPLAPNVTPISTSHFSGSSIQRAERLSGQNSPVPLTPVTPVESEHSNNSRNPSKLGITFDSSPSSHPKKSSHSGSPPSARRLFPLLAPPENISTIPEELDSKSDNESRHLNPAPQSITSSLRIILPSSGPIPVATESHPDSEEGTPLFVDTPRPAQPIDIQFSEPEAFKDKNEIKQLVTKLYQTYRISLFHANNPIVDKPVIELSFAERGTARGNRELGTLVFQKMEEAKCSIAYSLVWMPGDETPRQALFLLAYDIKREFKGFILTPDFCILNFQTQSEFKNKNEISDYIGTYILRLLTQKTCGSLQKDAAKNWIEVFATKGFFCCKRSLPTVYLHPFNQPST